MKSIYLLFVVLFAGMTSLQAQANDCIPCTISRINNQNVYSAGCADPTNICSLILGPGLNSISLREFTNLCNVAITIETNTNPTFSGASLTTNGTVFHTNGGGINIAIVDENGSSSTYSSGAGNNPNGVNALNTSLRSCPAGGTCSLMSPQVLPVTLRDWTAKRGTKSVDLQWSTEAEVGSDYFRVLHSTDGYDFNEIARVPSYGAAHEYQLVHDRPGTGTNYYQLEQVDLDGTRAALGLRTILWNGTNTASVAVYPNPAAPGEVVNLPGLEEIQEVELLDATGRVVQRFINPTGGVELAPTLQPGLYLLRTPGGMQRLMVQ